MNVSISTKFQFAINNSRKTMYCQFHTMRGTLVSHELHTVWMCCTWRCNLLCVHKYTMHCILHRQAVSTFHRCETARQPKRNFWTDENYWIDDNVHVTKGLKPISIELCAIMTTNSFQILTMCARSQIGVCHYPFCQWTAEQCFFFRLLNKIRLILNVVTFDLNFEFMWQLLKTPQIVVVYKLCTLPTPGTANRFQLHYKFINNFVVPFST